MRTSEHIRHLQDLHKGMSYGEASRMARGRTEAAVKKTRTKKVVQDPVTKKVAVKKEPVKKAVTVKKAPAAKKAAPAKKAAVKKTASKKKK